MYNRLKNNGKSHKQAVTACSRKLLTVVWSVLKSKRPFCSDTGLLARASDEAEELEAEN